ncbi:MAG: hypothetical protein ABFC77_02260 [Thermoguttaceae bacterium]
MKSLCTLGIVVLCLAVACSAEDRTFADKRSDKAEKTAAEYRKNIQAELKTLKTHEWAGEYYEGDGLGENVSLVLAPKSGFLFEWHGCMGLYDRNYGTVSVDKGIIHLAFTFPNERKGFQGIAPEFIPIAWGGRKYLIPTDDMKGFCNDVNDGSEPRKGSWGAYLLRRGDEKKEAEGFPSVPAEFSHYLLKQPIEAEIVAVGEYKTRPSVCDWKFKDTPVVLNRGKVHGLLKGMKLHVVKPNNVVESVEVTKVEDERSEGVMTQAGEKEAGPQVGWKLSTRCPWHQPQQQN